MPKTIKQSLEEKLTGFYIGTRLVLPFRCQILKLIFEKEIFTEMVGSEHIKIHQDPKNTSIYLRSPGRLANFVGTYKVIKMIVCEWDSDLTNMENHVKLICEINDHHSIQIHIPSDDMLFIE